MKSINIIKHFGILFCILFLGIQLVCANQTFQNNLLRTDFYKTPLGEIKITLYTSKSYDDPIVVNKKSDFEYVVLIPEMSNAMTASPILNPVADIVSAVNFKTQQYEDNIKGYTKITIFTKKPAEIMAQTQTLESSEYSFSESDYEELLAQTTKKKTEQAKQKKETVKPIKKPKSTTVSKTTDKSAAKASKEMKPRTKKSVVVSKVQKVKSSKKSAKIKPVKKLTKTRQKPVVSYASSNLTTTQSEIPKIETPIVKTIETTPVLEENPTAAEEINLPEKIQATTPPVQKERRLHKYKRIIKNNLYTILGILFAIFFFLLIIARKIKRNATAGKKVFKSNLEEKPLNTTDFSEKINENMTWKEKFQTYVDVKNQTLKEDIQESKTTPPHEELDELFEPQQDLSEEASEKDIESEISPEEIIKDELRASTAKEAKEEQSEITQEVAEEEISDLDKISEVIETDNLPKFDEEVSLDELFGEEEGFITEENKERIKAATEETEEIKTKTYTSTEITEEVEAADEIVKSEFVIDEEKGFYLVDFEDETSLVGHIDDEIFVLKQFGKKVQGPIKARLDEKKNSTASYMTKVENFRGLVEVTPEKMNLLIEL